MWWTRWFFPTMVYFLIIAVFLKHYIYISGNEPRSVEIHAMLPAFSIPLLNDDNALLTNKSLHGEVALVHFFASWCGACRLEQADISALAKNYGIPVYGIAWRDKPASLIAWLGEDIKYYHSIGMDKLGRAAVAFGIWGVPETFMVDKQGIIRYRYRGYMGSDEIKNRLLPLYRRLLHAP